MKVLRAGDLIGLPVVSIASGDDVAEIRDVIYDGEAQRLIGFTLNKRGWLAGRMKAVLPAESLGGIGPDAIMIPDEEAVTERSDAPAELRHGADARPVLGNRVLSADGRDLGEVIGVIIATGATPQAVGYEIGTKGHADTAFIPISAQLAVSGQNLLLPAEATEFIRNDLAGFGAAVASYRSAELERER